VNLPRAYSVGVATHTGWVRVNNEDDYLIAGAPVAAKETVLCAIADGMGGAAGGAEASRLGLRALGVALFDAASAAPLERRIATGFAAAASRVFEEAANVPALRGMGTTMSALCLQDGLAHIGHVGDTRIYRLRDDACVQLTTDHAARQPDNLLTRCIGGGHATCEVDQSSLELRPGDRFLLASDGVWSTVPGEMLGKVLARGAPQAAADALVALALRAGGPDNATAMVVEVVDPAAVAESRAVDLPRDERPGMRDLWPRPGSLRAPLWPWLLWSVAAALFGAALLRWWWGIDVWAWFSA
jgi:serine/threonine protein phosphatase PrpC